MTKKPVAFVPFHLIIDARGDHAAESDDGSLCVLLACGAPQAAAYITWNTAAVTCNDCLFIYHNEAEHGVNTALLQSFYSFPPSHP